MSTMTLYQGLFLAHVLAVVIWLGGSATMLLLWRRALVSNNDEAIKAQSEASMWVERRLAIPAAIVVLLAGGWLMTEGNWGMDQGWLHIGMGAVFGAAGISLLWTGRFQRRLISGGRSPALIARITAGLLASTAMVLVAFWAMVAKPWS